MWFTKVKSVFGSDTYSTAILYVPTGCKAVYSAATGWNKFTDIDEKDFTDVSEIEAGGGLRVRASGFVLYIDNEGSAVQAGIYTADGKQVKRLEAANGTTSMSMQTGNVYLIKVGERTFKVAM